MRALRIIVMWLLALAVPVQGFAAASMFNCGPGHAGKASSQALVHAGHVHDHDRAAPDHHHADAGVVADVDSSADGHATPAVHKGSCSACASCCTAAGLPSTLIGFDAITFHDAVVPLGAVPVAAFLTGGTERPPRPFLA